MLLVLGSLVMWIWPRGLAAWKLHNQAVAYADYGLCMVGPTGPQLLREQPQAFRELVRRRLISARPQDTPLLRCQSKAEEIGVKHRAYRVHGAPAGTFSEYKNTPGGAASATIADLDLSVSRLEALADEAWPFVRSDPGVLMKASSHAYEARHSSAPPALGSGSGLPAERHLYRSSAAYGDTIVVALGSGANARSLISKNRGVNWTTGGRKLNAEVRDRCVADDDGRAYTLSRTNDGKRIVLSHGPGAAPQVAVLSPVNQQIAGISCDESSLVAALVLDADETGHRPVRLRVCPFRRPCRDLRAPNLGGDKLYYPVDIARMSGDTILSRTSGGITRVSSSRDDGRSWLPWVVAYDRVSSGDRSPAPFRLLVAADDLLLYAGSNAPVTYALLVSKDHGASFRAPVSHEASTKRSARSVVAGVK